MEQTNKPVVLTEKTAIALGFLQQNEGRYLGAEVAAATGLDAKGIHGVLGALYKKGLVDKADHEVEAKVVAKDGTEKMVTKTLKVYFLTEAGRDFVINA